MAGCGYAAGRDVASSVSTRGFGAADDVFTFNAPITGSELHGDRLAVGIRGLEELTRREVEHAGENVRGEYLNLGIEVAHHRVVVATRVLDRVFRVAQRALQLGELFRCLQLRIILGHGEQALQRSG